jgi:type VI secretion system protein ImpE
VTGKELFEKGDLQGAIDAVTAEVKAHPNDPVRRTFLFELLCFTGELDRAGRQLDVIGHQDPAAEPAAQVYRNILHAEHLRRRLYAESLQPEFLEEPPDYVRLHVEAAGQLRQEHHAEATALLERSEEMRPALRGQIDGQPFQELRDCDDLLAPVLEFILLRDYVWVPFEQIREIEISAPERPRDLLWAPARLVLEGGKQQRGYIPVLYHGSDQHADTQVKLGRLTDWTGAENAPVRGVGQRMLLAGEEGHAILTIRRIEIERAQ